MKAKRVQFTITLPLDSMPNWTGIATALAAQLAGREPPPPTGPDVRYARNATFKLDRLFDNQLTVAEMLPTLVDDIRGAWEGVRTHDRN